MRLKEQKLWDRMRKNLRGVVNLQRIENLAGEGIPDVLALKEARVTFVELKCAAKLPARVATALLGRDGLNVDQLNWHLGWRKHGGKSLIIVGVNDTPMHWAINGVHADLVNMMPVADLNQYALVRSEKTNQLSAFWRAVGALF